MLDLFFKKLFVMNLIFVFTFIFRFFDTTVTQGVMKNSNRTQFFIIVFRTLTICL